MKFIPGAIPTCKKLFSEPVTPSAIILTDENVVAVPIAPNLICPARIACAL